MIAKRSVFIIPGFRHKPTHKAYKTIAKMLKKEGYNPILVTIPWRDTTISENTDYFLTQYKKVDTKKKYILGFSFGAMIAFLAATKVRASGLMLCSLSPYFREDMRKLHNSKTLPKYQDFNKLRCKALAKKIKTKHIVMLYGENETKPLINRVNCAFSNIASTHKYLIPVQKTEHNIADKRYLDTIHLATKAFL